MWLSGGSSVAHASPGHRYSIQGQSGTSSHFFEESPQSSWWSFVPPRLCLKIWLWNQTNCRRCGFSKVNKLTTQKSLESNGPRFCKRLLAASFGCFFLFAVFWIKHQKCPNFLLGSTSGHRAQLHRCFPHFPVVKWEKCQTGYARNVSVIKIRNFAAACRLPIRPWSITFQSFTAIFFQPEKTRLPTHRREPHLLH